MKKTGVLGLLVLMMGVLLAACGESHEAMVRQLEALEQMNRADSVMTNDSLAEALTTYFDSHGTANERLRAHYILGRTYADMGEAPADLNAYLDAADCADTTAADCDYHTLSRVYGQMADVFYWQNLMEDFIDACDKSIAYAWKDKDTSQALNVEAHKIGAYIRLEQHDKVITAFDTVYDKLLNTCGVETAAKYCILPVYALLEKGYWEKAKTYIDHYKTESNYFDSAGNVEKGREVFYYYKGRYFLAIQQYDSAEYYFRKELRNGTDAMNQNMGSLGLSRLFMKVHRPDSAAKYALYSYEMNDSVYAQMATKEVEQAKASYNYQRNKELAVKEKQRAEHSRFLLLLLSALSVAVVLVLLLAFSVYRKRKQAQLFRYQRDLEHLERAQTELMEKYSSEAIQSERQESEIAVLKKEIEEYQVRIVEYQQKLMAKDIAKLEERLCTAPIVKHLKELAATNPYQPATSKDMKLLRQLLNAEIPQFYSTLNTPAYTLRPIEYDISLLIRCHFTPSEIYRLTGTTDAYVSKMRKTLLSKVFGITGTPKQYDSKVMAIV